MKKMMIVLGLLVAGLMLFAVDANEISFHGYGEIHFNNSLEDGGTAKMDFHRMVLGWMVPFSETIIFDGEIDFEHAATELELEYAKIDFLFNEAINLRAGAMLMPMGSINEMHEPVNYYSVERPYLHKYIIPTTWQEGGAGIFGSLDNLSYRLYLVNGMNGLNFTGKSGIRKGREKVASAKSETMALTGRVEFSGIEDITLGASGYFGRADHDLEELEEITVSIFTANASVRKAGFELKAETAMINLDNTESLFAVADDIVGEKMLGWNAELAYRLGNVLPLDLRVFSRYEYFNTHEEVADEFEVNDAYEKNLINTGIAYYPIHNVVVKADYEMWEDGNEESWEQINLGLGYEF